MTIPKGYKLPQLSTTNKVYKFNKSLFGIKQTNKQQYFKLSDFTIPLGDTHSNVDCFLFIKSCDNQCIATSVCR